MSFYDAFDRFGLAAPQKLRGLIEIAQSCGWWAPYQGACIFQHRHCQLHRDERGRLHNTTGAAVLYRDGWGVYAVHGTRVPADIITDRSSITTKRIDGERNTEVRRVMIELYGQERYLIDSKAKLIHRDDWGSLYRKELPDDEPLVMVKVVNSTAEPDGTFKDYFLRVPPTIETARQAVAWTFDVKADEYAPLVET